MVRGWSRRSRTVSADTARKITGISTPFGGIQWADAGPSERERIRGFILFLEDRRVLYNPDELEVPEQVVRSAHEIRQECTSVLRILGENAFGAIAVRAIRSACRRFHDEMNLPFRFFDDRHPWEGAPGFFTALGGLRATVGQQIALLAAHYDLDVEGDLASVLPELDGETP